MTNIPAFPEKKKIYKAGYPTQEYDEVGGMTLRDYFAAKAMQAIIERFADWKYMPETISAHAYSQADAMLKIREKNE